MSLHLPSQSFRDNYCWRDQAPHPRLPFDSDGRVQSRRARYEFYPTPPEATRALLSLEFFDGSIWEPACGQGHISKVLTGAGYEVVSTDLIQRDYGAGGVNFLGETRPRSKHITSPTHPMGAVWPRPSSRTRSP